MNFQNLSKNKNNIAESKMGKVPKKRPCKRAWQKALAVVGCRPRKGTPKYELAIRIKNALQSECELGELKRCKDVASLEEIIQAQDQRISALTNANRQGKTKLKKRVRKLESTVSQLQKRLKINKEKNLRKDILTHRTRDTRKEKGTVLYKLRPYQLFDDKIGGLIKAVKNATAILPKDYPDFKSNTAYINLVIEVRKKVKDKDEVSTHHVSISEIDITSNQAITDRIRTRGNEILIKYQQSDAVVVVLEVELIFLPSMAGGCHKGSKAFLCLSQQSGEIKTRRKYVSKKGNKKIRIKAPVSDNNNCLFKCLEELKAQKLGIKRERLSKVKCNLHRKQFQLKKNCKVPINLVQQIAETCYSLNVSIVNSENDGLYLRENADGVIMYANEHYLLVEGYEVKKCPDCKVAYSEKHDPINCLKRQTYLQVHRPANKAFKGQKKENALRKVIPKQLRPKNATDEYMTVCHYDLETHPNRELNNNSAQVYAIGYSWYDDEGMLQYVRHYGENCMEMFIDRLYNDGGMDRVKFLNAYNGSRFDHYLLMGAELKYAESLKKMNPLKAPSGIIRGKVAGRQICDISKILGGGSLSNQLRAWKCQTQKGEFDHDSVYDYASLSQTQLREMDKYLQADVLGLVELGKKLHDVCDTEFNTSWVHFISASQMTYDMCVNNWCYLSQDAEEMLDVDTANALIKSMYLPTPSQESFFRKSIYGGRTNPNKKYFKSQDYEKIRKEYEATGEVSSTTEDYLSLLDVVSLYPSVMKANHYPVGEPIVTKQYMPNKLGIYRVSYECNTKLLTAVLPRHDEYHKLHWDLASGEGIYTSVDIENALARGYKVDIAEGYYWENSAPIFKSYISKMYKRKEEAVKGSPQYTMAKLMLNGLYGKTIQRPVYDKVFYVNDDSQWGEIMAKYLIERIDTQLSYEWAVYCISRDPELRQKNISKPTHLGTFILAYSRQLMLKYMDEANPNNTIKDLHYYTDTDSIFVHSSSAKRMKLGENLGDLDDDLSGGKIVLAYFIAPKLYYCEYITRDNVIKQKIACKGGRIDSPNRPDKMDVKTFRRYELKAVRDQYKQMYAGKSLDIDGKQFRRHFLNINKKDKERGIDIFSITIDQTTKTLNGKGWEGRDWYGNYSLPKGFEGCPVLA